MAKHMIKHHPSEDAVTLYLERPVQRKMRCIGAVMDIKGASRDITTKRIYKQWTKLFEYACDGNGKTYICTDWLKFSNFLEWYKSEQASTGGSYMDTPRIDGIKIYSPKYSTLIG